MISKEDAIKSIDVTVREPVDFRFVEKSGAGELSSMSPGVCSKRFCLKGTEDR